MTTEIQDCNNKAFYAFGTASIFTRRANELRKYRTLLVFFGIIGPILVGAAAGAFGAESGLVFLLIVLAGTCSIFQLGFSAWALVSNWDGKFEYAIESAQANNELFTELDSLAKRNPQDFSEKFVILSERNRLQEARDMKAGITQEEKRFAMRSSLLQFRQSCSSCNQIPTTMKPSNCDLCGNFKEKEK